jgi:putative hemin transport protein
MLIQRYEALLAEQPRTRTRDAADRLSVGECELQIALGAVRLAPESWPAYLDAVRSLGPVMALTRNHAVVHERTGAFLEVRMDHPHVGGVYGPDIDLRLFPQCWAHLLAVQVDTPRGPRRSLQLYDDAGTAVQKLYAVDGTDLVAWDALVAGFTPSEPLPEPTFAAVPAPQPDGEASQQELLERWAAMTDTHDFFLLLRTLGLGRRRALELAEGHHAWRVPDATLRRTLEAAAARGTPIMVFVGNRGCIQIHSGPVERIVEKGAWLNVLDPAFNLHVRLEAIQQVWVVHKPTDDGIVSSLEAMDADGSVVLQLFGVRKPGLQEDPSWRALTDQARTPHPELLVGEAK